NAPFPVRQRIAVEAGGDLLFERGARNQIARELFDRELIEGEVSIEGIDHPVPVTPCVRTGRVLFVAIAVGITSEVEPVPAPALTEVGQVERAIDEPFPSVGARIRDERFDFFRTRRQTQEIETEPADERPSIGFGTRLDLLRFQTSENETIDGISHPAL